MSKFDRTSSGGSERVKRGPKAAARNTDTDDERRQAPLSMSLFKRMFRYTRPYAPKRNWLFFMVVLRSIQGPMLAWAAAGIINGPIRSRDFSATAWWTSGFAALALSIAVVYHFRARLAGELGEFVVHDLRRDIFAKLQRLPMRFYDQTKLGRIISRMTSDAEAVRRGVQEVLFVSLVQAGNMLVAAAVMAYSDLVLFAVVLLISPILYLLTNYFRTRIGQAWREVQESFSRVTASIAESVNGIRVTQGFVRQETNARNFNELIEDHSEYNVNAATLTGTFLPLVQLNNQFFISILVVLGGYQVLYGSLLTGEQGDAQLDALITFLFMANLFFAGIATIGRMYNQSLTAMAGAERVFALLDREHESLDREDSITLPRIDGLVEFDHVSFGYDEDRPVIHDLSFTAEPGQTIALVGQTGSGKSTIIKLISKFYLPTHGYVRIDDHELSTISTESLTRQLGIVLQTNFLFSGTVMDNIRVGQVDATDEQVIAATDSLGCRDLFEGMQDGFQTQVGERGGALSLGQRQLVCFARAMLADPRIMILDEATSSVDTMTEARIQKALEKLFQNRTNFVVAHRLSTIRHADRVLVLNQGQLVENGSHNELLATGGIYANLYRQFIHASEA